MSEKLLSIIIPSYNMEKYLDRCLTSLIVPDPECFDLLEIIVVNDGSRDGTSELAHSYEARHLGTIRVIDKPNGHYGSCINVALSSVHGRYVRILDADDRFETEGFERYIRELAGFAASGQVVDMILSDTVLSNRYWNFNKRFRFSLPCGKVLDYDAFARAGQMIQMPNVAYRTKMLREMGYRQTEGVLYTDTEWTHYPLTHVGSVLYISELVYHYYIGRAGQSMDPNVCNRSFEPTLRMLETAISLRKQMPLPPKRCEILDRFIVERIAGLYQKPILNCNLDEANSLMRMHDGRLKELSGEWYAYATTLKYPTRTCFGFHYVTAFRNGSVGRFYVGLFRATHWLMGKMWRIVTKPYKAEFSEYKE